MDDDVTHSKKILVLSLGSGGRIEDKPIDKGKKESLIKRVFQKIGGKKTSFEKNYDRERYYRPYRTAKYRFENEEEIVESSLVAKPLIDKVRPDVILIIGTVKSAWDTFFYNFHGETDDWQNTWEVILDKVRNSSKNDEDDKICRFKEELDDLFSKEVEVKGNPVIKTCVIRYGLNDEEIKYNYSKILDSIGEVVEATGDSKNKEYDVEVSFDITHSFRSIPLYNLAAINYYGLLSDREIRITHVYYGNLDVSRENDGVSQIVDLVDVINVFEMTRGVSEFINTGSAGTLATKSHVNNEFMNTLEQFDKAIKYSRRDEIQRSLVELLNNDGNIQEKDAQFDAQRTIKKILQKEFNNKDDSIAEFQISLASWCLRIGQVGLAATIAKEALRSFLVRVYETDSKKFEDEKSRIRAEQLFFNARKYQSDNELFANYDVIEKKAVDIRNTYAHNLSNDVKDLEIEVSTQYEEWEDTINRYIGLIRDILKLETEKLYHNEIKKIKNNKKIVMIISEKKDKEEYETYKKHVTSKKLNHYDRVFWLHEIGYHQELIEGGEKKYTGNKEDTRKICRVIAYKINEFKKINEGLTRVSFGDDIPKEILDNCVPIIKSYVEGDFKLFKYRIKNDVVKEEALEDRCSWKIDIEYEMSDTKLEGGRKKIDKSIITEI